MHPFGNHIQSGNSIAITLTCRKVKPQIGADVIVGNAAGSPPLSVGQGQSDGSFSKPKQLVVGDAAVLSRFVAVGDLNGDRLPDVVVADRTSVAADGSSRALYVLLNVGEGTLGPPTRFALSGTQTSVPLSAMVRDLNGDGMGEVLIRRQ